MRAMRRRALFALFLAIALPACTLTGAGEGTATGAPTEAIEVTPLDGAEPADAAEAPSPGASPSQNEQASLNQDAADADPTTEAASADRAETEGNSGGASAAEDAAPETADAAVAEPPPAPALSPAAHACLKRGGKWVGTGSSGLMACVRTTRDAGKTCRRQADCQGYCLARSRSCAPYTPLFGCNEVLGPNGERSTICLD
jgi:hypothetical protein